MLGYTKEDQYRVGYPEGTVFREENIWKDYMLPMLLLVFIPFISIWVCLIWFLN